MKTTIILHSLFSEFSKEQLHGIIDLADKYGASFRVVVTGIQLYNVEAEDKPKILSQLPKGVKQVIHAGVNSITCCRGTDGCSHAFMQTIPLGKALDTKHFGRPLPNKLRIGISGCTRCCAEPMIKDIGLYGLPDGFVLTVGGKSGAHPKGGEILVKGLSPEEAQEKIEYLLDWYEKEAMPKERFTHLLERLGNPFTDK